MPHLIATGLPASRNDPTGEELHQTHAGYYHRENNAEELTSNIDIVETNPQRQKNPTEKLSGSPEGCMIDRNNANLSLIRGQTNTSRKGVSSRESPGYNNFISPSYTPNDDYSSSPSVRNNSNSSKRQLPSPPCSGESVTYPGADLVSERELEQHVKEKNPVMKSIRMKYSTEEEMASAKNKVEESLERSEGGGKRERNSSPEGHESTEDRTYNKNSKIVPPSPKRVKMTMIQAPNSEPSPYATSYHLKKRYWHHPSDRFIPPPSSTWNCSEKSTGRPHPRSHPYYEHPHHPRPFSHNYVPPPLPQVYHHSYGPYGSGLPYTYHRDYPYHNGKQHDKDRWDNEKKTSTKVTSDEDKQNYSIKHKNALSKKGCTFKSNYENDNDANDKSYANHHHNIIESSPSHGLDGANPDERNENDVRNSSSKEDDDFTGNVISPPKGSKSLTISKTSSFEPTDGKSIKSSKVPFRTTSPGMLHYHCPPLHPYHSSFMPNCPHWNTKVPIQIPPSPSIPPSNRHMNGHEGGAPGHEIETRYPHCHHPYSYAYDPLGPGGYHGLPPPPPPGFSNGSYNPWKKHHHGPTYGYPSSPVHPLPPHWQQNPRHISAPRRTMHNQAHKKVSTDNEEHFFQKAESSECQSPHFNHTQRDQANTKNKPVVDTKASKSTRMHNVDERIQSNHSINSVTQWQEAHMANNGLAPSTNRCVMLPPPIPSKFWGDMEKMKDTFLPEFHKLVNYPDYLPKNRSSTSNGSFSGTSTLGPMRRCVMCGKERLCNASMTITNSSVSSAKGLANNKNISPKKGSTLGACKKDEKSSGSSSSSGSHPNEDSDFSESIGATIHIIPRQNKGLCTACDVAVWVMTKNKMEIKWCKGCKNFRPWAAFGDKGLATKCLRCRSRQRDKYAAQRENLKRKRLTQKQKEVVQETEGKEDANDTCGRDDHCKSSATVSEEGNISKGDERQALDEAAIGLTSLIAAVSAQVHA